MSKREWFIVSVSFIFIFTFATLDSAIAPLVKEFHLYYDVSMPMVLELISYCTFGIVIGTFIGPLFVAHMKIRTLLNSTVLLLAIGSLGFLLTHSFTTALVVRLLLGIAIGVSASLLWWITYDGMTTQKSIDSMLVVMLSARPVAISLGVPLVAYIGAKSNAQFPLFFFAFCLIASGLLLGNIKYKRPGVVSSSKPKVSIHSLVSEYTNVFKIPFARTYYLSTFLNSFGSFGFYSLGGIWFIEHYKLSTEQISLMFLIMGASEVAATFISPKILKTSKLSFTLKFVFSAAALAFFIYIGGHLPLYAALFFIFIFIVLNRVQIFAMMKFLPQIFNDYKNKSTLGSLATLFSWLGFAAVSGMQARIIPHVGVTVTGIILGIITAISLYLAWTILSNKVIGSEVSMNFWKDDNYVSRYNEQYPLTDEEISLYQKYLELTPNDHLLDLGCGNGDLLISSSRLYRSAVGVDMSPPQIKEFRSRVNVHSLGNKIQIIEANFKTLDVSKHRFTKCFAGFSLHHLTDIEKSRFFRKLSSSLETGSRLLIHDMIFSFPKNELKQRKPKLILEASQHYRDRWPAKMQDIVDTWFKEYPTDIFEWTNILEQTGFNVIERKHFSSFLGLILAVKK